MGLSVINVFTKICMAATQLAAFEAPRHSLSRRHGNHRKETVVPLVGEQGLTRMDYRNSPSFCIDKNIWSFPEMGVPQNGWFIREHPIKMDDD